MCVIGCDDQDVFDGQGANDAVTVGSRPADQRFEQPRHLGHLVGRGRAVADVDDRPVSQAPGRPGFFMPNGRCDIRQLRDALAEMTV